MLVSVLGRSSLAVNNREIRFHSDEVLFILAL